MSMGNPLKRVVFLEVLLAFEAKRGFPQTTFNGIVCYSVSVGQVTGSSSAVLQKLKACLRKGKSLCINGGRLGPSCLPH